MKLSKIQQIIKEEVAKALHEENGAENAKKEVLVAYKEFRDKIDSLLTQVDDDTYKILNQAFNILKPLKDSLYEINENKQVRLEELPDYDKLPTTNADVKKRDLTRAEVILRLEDSTVFSKEEAQEWRDDFKNRWMDNKEEPLFTYERKPLAGKEVVFAKVINSPKHTAVKSKGPGPGPEADLGDYYGPGAPRYTGD